jgi:hypothetical protein
MASLLNVGNMAVLNAQARGTSNRKTKEINDASTDQQINEFISIKLRQMSRLTIGYQKN